jgi:universal stress protein E
MNNSDSHHPRRSSGVRRILVAVKDPWARTLPAVDKAVQLARAFGARLELFHSMSDPVYIDVAEFHGQDLASLENEQRNRVLARLELLAKRIGHRGLTTNVAVEWDFPPHEAVIRAADAFKADLIVAERHPTSHHLPMLLRFTDFELLRCSPVPVLLVKTRETYARPKILAAVDPGHTYAKPVSLDAEILRLGSAVADALRGALHVVHAFEPLPAGAMNGDYISGEWVTELEDASEKQARSALERTVRDVEIPRSRQHLIARHPIDAIEQAASAIGSDIVVMGAISRSGLKRLVLGNTAEKLLDHLPCDVLVVKPRRFTNRVPRTRRGAQLIALSAYQPGI